MLGREPFVWDCVIMDADTRQVEQYELTTFWSPEKVTADEIANTAAAQATIEGRKKYIGASATLREPEVVTA